MRIEHVDVVQARNPEEGPWRYVDQPPEVIHTRSVAKDGQTRVRTGQVLKPVRAGRAQARNVRGRCLVCETADRHPGLRTQSDGPRLAQAVARALARDVPRPVRSAGARTQSVDAVIEEMDGRMIRVGERWLADFASCNYLGFDLNREIIDGMPERSTSGALTELVAVAREPRAVPGDRGAADRAARLPTTRSSSRRSPTSTCR